MRRLIRSLLLAAAGLLALAALLPLAAAPPARADELESALQGLTARSSSEVEAAVQALVATGHPVALPVLEAMMARNLRVGPQGGLYILDESTDRAHPVPDGPAVAADSLELDKPRLNNRLRRALLPAIARLRLVSPDPRVRLTAARELAKNPSDEAAGQVRVVLEHEQDPEVRDVLQLMLAQIGLASDDPGRRLEAVETLRATQSMRYLSELNNVLALDANGEPVEPDPRVRETARLAVAEIERRQSLINAGANLLYGLSLGSILLLAALGLAITFGLMGVINMAHGEMLMIGAYATYTMQGLFAALWPAAADWYLLAAVPVAFAVCAAVGMALERGVIRFLYGRPLESLLATWGISLLLIQAVRHIFGAQNVAVANPAWLSGGVAVAEGLVLPYNRIAIVLFSAAVVAGVWLLMQRTPLGLRVRAVTQNRPIAASLGVRTARLDMWTFGLGSGVAGLGGLALSQVGNVGPELGQSYIVDSFLVVVLGGVGKIAGAVVGALGLGIMAKYLEPLSDAVLAKILLLGFIILFIQKRPQGLFALKGRAAEG